MALIRQHLDKSRRAQAREAAQGPQPPTVQADGTKVIYRKADDSWF